MKNKKNTQNDNVIQWTVRRQEKGQVEPNERG